jgi:hypothetical protein
LPIGEKLLIVDESERIDESNAQARSNVVTVLVSAGACQKPARLKLLLTSVHDLLFGAWRCEDLVADSIVNELSERMHANLAHDFRPVRLHCSDAYS